MSSSSETYAIDIILVFIVQVRKQRSRTFGDLPWSLNWFVEDPEILQPEPVLVTVPSMASQRVVIDIMSFDGVLHECVQKVGYGDNNIKVLVHEIEQKPLTICN